MTVILTEWLAGAGAVGIIACLAAWLGKVWANRILQQDRTKYETQMQTLLQDFRKRIDKELFVHRLQFEKEFNAYLELWKRALPAARVGIPFRTLTRDYNDTHDEQV